VPATRDYYSILQVNPNASGTAIDVAYDRLARLYDPETSRKQKAASRKEELDEAYEVLSDPKRRSEYDRMRSRGYRPGQAPPEPGTGVRGAGRRAWDLVDNPYVFAGITGVGVMVILVGIVLISVLSGGDDDDAAVAEVTPTANPAPTLPAQTPGTPPAAPPPVTGETVTTASGLQYIDIAVGAGAMPATGDRLAVNYTGWLQSDNTMFDSSVDGDVPFDFVLGTQSVIAGWDEGVATMQKGGKRRLIIPPNLAYGEAGQGSIPPNATLIFDIDLVEIFPGGTATPSPAPATDTPAPTVEASPSP
jgi:peptidylprolyl isomerase